MILDDVRESGLVNMGSSARILEGLGLGRSEAKAVSCAWMATFDDQSVEQRVEEAFEEVYGLLKN